MWLSILCVAVEIKNVVTHDLVQGDQVDGEESGTKHGALRSALVNWGVGEGVVVEPWMVKSRLLLKRNDLKQASVELEMPRS